MSEADMAAEVERLRAEVEAYRQREIDSYKSQLATANSEIERLRIAVEHYRSEAQRNADVGNQIYQSHLEEKQRLEAQIEAMSSAKLGRNSGPIRG